VILVFGFTETRISNQRRDLSTLWWNGVTDNRESRLSNGDFQMRRMSALGRNTSIRCGAQIRHVE
jgi:hypothetical protein